MFSNYYNTHRWHQFGIVFLFLTILNSNAIAQQKSVESEMGQVNMEALNAALKEVTGNHRFLSRSQARTQLKEVLNRQITLKPLKPNDKLLLSGAEVYRNLKPSTLILVSSSNRATGFVVQEDGICITNYHVLEIFSDTTKQNSPLFAITANDKCYAVTAILTCSKINDIAILKIDTKEDKLKPLSFGADAEVGSDVFTLGHPAHILYYFSKGIVAKNFVRNAIHYPDEDFRMDITAEFSLGESGAPVVDNKGNLVGTVSAATALYGDPGSKNNPQMVLHSTIPVIAIQQLIKTEKK